MTQPRKGRTAAAAPASDTQFNGVDAGNAPPVASKDQQDVVNLLKDTANVDGAANQPATSKPEDTPPDVPQASHPVVDLMKDPVADGMDNPSAPATAEGDVVDVVVADPDAAVNNSDLVPAEAIPTVPFGHDLVIKNTGRTRFESITQTTLVSGQTIVVQCVTAAIRRAVLNNIAQYNHLSGADVLTIVDGTPS